MKGLGALQRHQLPHPLAKILDPPLTQAHNTNGMSIGSAVFVKLAVCDQQTHRPSYICSSKPHMMQPNSTQLNSVRWQHSKHVLRSASTGFLQVISDSKSEFKKNVENCFIYHRFIAKKTQTNTHTHPFNGSLSGTTRVSRYQKGKTNLDFTEARDSEWQWHQLGHMQVCTSIQTDNHASTPPPSVYDVGWALAADL